MQIFFNATSALAPAVIAAAVPMVPMPDNPEMYYAFVVLIGGLILLAGVNQLMTFLRGLKEQPRPAQTYATKEELKICRQEFLLEVRKLETELREGNRAQEDRASKIHSRVDQVLAAVCRIEGVVDGQARKK